MRLRTLDFERQAAKRIRRQVRTSPTLWRTYRWQLLLNRINAAFYAYSAVIAVIAGFVILVIQNIPFFRLLSDGAAQPNGLGANAPAAALALQATVFTGVALLFINFAGRFRNEQQFPVLAYYPVTDEYYLRFRIPELLFVLCVTAALMPVPIAVGVLAGVQSVDWVALPIVLLLEEGLLFATPIVAALVIRTVPAQGFLAMLGVFVLVIGGFAIAIAGSTIPRDVEMLVRVLYAVVPASWAVAIWNYAVLQGQPAAWLLLLPIGGFLALAWRPARRLRRFHELSISSDRRVERVFPHLQWWELPGGLKTVDEPLVELFPPAARPRQELPDLRAAEDAVRSGKYLASHAWSKRGLLEWWLARRLNERERTIMDYWQGGPYHWSRGWFVLFSLAMPALAMVVQFPAAALAQPLTIRMYSGLALIVALMIANIDPSKDAQRRTDLPAVPLFAQFPLTIREVLRANNKVATWLLLFALPVAIGFGWFVGGQLAGQPEQGAIAAAIPLVMMYIVQPVLVCGAFSAATNDTHRVGRYIVATTLVLVLVSAAGCVLAIGFEDWPLLVISGGILLVCSRFLCWLCVRAFERWEVDIIR